MTKTIFRFPFSYLIYRGLMMLISPVLLIWLLKTAESVAQIWMRLGRVKHPLVADVWLHCASVGEVNAVMPLVKVLRANHKSLLITCFTSSGLAQAQRRLAEMQEDHGIPCLLLPVDWHWTTSRFLSQLTVKELWLMETELWPTLIMNARKKGIRLKLVNGRLSPKTLNVPKLWRNLLAYLLTYQIGTCLLRSEQDKAYYIQLGVMPEKLQVTGNIKLCDESSQLLSQYYSASYIVFASTHEPEELQLARLWQQHPTLPKLVIVPRHPKRGKALVQVLSQAGILVSQRSVNPDQHKGIIIADTFGELLSWMAYSEMVIMGGSFAPKGGQNPIEPARLGKFIIAGADMHDFADEARALTQVGAMQSFPHIDESLIVYIKSLLKQPEQLVQKGALGRAWLLQTQQQVMTDTLIALGLDKS